MPHKRAKRSVREQSRSANDLAPGSQSRNSLSNEAIPKSAARVLNAMKIQDDFMKKRRGEDDGTQSKPSKKRKTQDEGSGQAKGKKGHSLKILPGESLAHFNRRVEESMRPLVRDAMQTSAAIARKVKKDEELEREAKKKGKAVSAPETSNKRAKGKGKADDSDESDDEAEPTKSSKPIQTAKTSVNNDNPKDFAAFSASAPRRLNDIAEAPPELKKLPRGAKPRKAPEAGATPSRSLRDGLLSMAQKSMLEDERERVIKAYREMKKGKATGA